MKQNAIYWYKTLFFLLVLVFFSCEKNTSDDILERHNLFRLEYGNFENEILFTDSDGVLKSDIHIVMRDGFFYIVNSEAGKIMQLTSYGDLIGIVYNEDKNPTPSFMELKNESVNSARQGTDTSSTQISLTYPFNNLGPIAVDSNKNVYVTDYLPGELYDIDRTTGTILSQIVLRFSPDGKFIDYLTQEGLGGMPFPNIINLYTTADNTLIVMCLDHGGYSAYRFSPEGFLLHHIPIQASLLSADLPERTYVTLENVIPDYNDNILYLKADYYTEIIDESTMVSSGIKFDKTLIHPFDMTTLTIGTPVTVPGYEKVISYGYTTETHSHPYSFIGVYEPGKLFFMIPNDIDFSVLTMDKNGENIAETRIDLPFQDIIFHDFALSNTGILSAFVATDDNASVSWWRTDTLGIVE